MAEAAGARRTAREVGFHALTMAGLAATFAFEHWIVHRQIILPTAEASGAVLPWMWGALLAPEMVVAFVAGWRLRGLGPIFVYGVSAALLRAGFEALLAHLGEPGHVLSHEPISEFVFGTPLVAVAYLVLFALASASGRSDDGLDGTFAGPE